MDKTEGILKTGVEVGETAFKTNTADVGIWICVKYSEIAKIIAYVTVANLAAIGIYKGIQRVVRQVKDDREVRTLLETSK